MKKLNITIIGGSNSAHSIIPLLSKAGHNVNLLTTRPEKWKTYISMKFTSPEGKTIDTVIGNVSKISDDPSELIPFSNIIVLCLPVSAYRLILNKIASHIRDDRKVFLGTIYGQAGFNWMVDEIKSKFHLDNITTFAIGLIPWITRTLEYGKIGLNYGPKKVNVIAISNVDDFEFLNDNFLNPICYDYFKVGKFQLAENFLSLTLSVDNQIIHLSRLFGLFLRYGGKWISKSDVPLFYRDYDDLSASLLKDLDDDYSRIRNRIISLYPEKDFSFMLNYLDLERLSYGSASNDIKESFITSKTLGQIPTPVVENEDGFWIFDKKHRFFTDDLYYGLAVAKWFGEKLQIETPIIDKIIYWAQDYIGDSFLLNGKLQISADELNSFKFGVPSSYSYTKVEDVID